MQSKGQHCPFLNRTDPRCSESFNIERLDHAFRYCFGRYTSCPVYLELLIERRVRRSSAPEPADIKHAGQPIIQVTVHRTAADLPAKPASLPALPGGRTRVGK